MTLAPAPATASSVIEVRNPSRRDEVVGTVRAASPADVDAAVRAAASAQPRWAALPLPERSAVLERIAVAVSDRAEELAQLLAREAGIPLGEARGEASVVSIAFRNAIDMAPEVLAPRETVTATGRVIVRSRPIGVIGCIVPWNAPLALTAQKLGPALAAGNGIVLKPSPLAPLAVGLLIEIIARELAEADMGGLLDLVVGDGDVGTALIAHPLVRKISFTGGGATARAIMRTAADTLTPIHFELGGNDAAIVLDDADLGLTAERIAQTAFRRAGQICYAVKRVYLPAARASEFADALVAAVDALAVGDALDERTTMGPVVAEPGHAFIAGLAERAVASGRTVRSLGTVLDADGFDGGWFHRPRVVVDAEQGDELVQVEQFGPLLPLVTYASEDDAIAWANATPYGLGSSVWSVDEQRAERFADRIEAGVTFVNHHRLSQTAFRHVPFGGVKESGMGWENSPAGMAEYLEFHSIDVHPS